MVFPYGVVMRIGLSAYGGCECSHDRVVRLIGRDGRAVATNSAAIIGAGVYRAAIARSVLHSLSRLAVLLPSAAGVFAHDIERSSGGTARAALGDGEELLLLLARTRRLAPGWRCYAGLPDIVVVRASANAAPVTVRAPRDCVSPGFATTRAAAEGT